MVLNDKTAIVTGAGRGIGKAIALALSKEGASVAVVDIDPGKASETRREIIDTGHAALAVSADISRSADVTRMVHITMERFGRIDILVNNAGLLSTTPILSLSEEEWDRVMAVNLKGVFLCSKHAAEAMVRQRSGRIINIASLAGKIGAPWQAAYCASKHGVIGLTEVLAIELGQYGITANSVCPGSTDTEMIREVFKTRAERREVSVEELMRGIVDKTPLGRIAQPDDIAQVVVFLASPVSSYITGQAINVCGGRSISLS